uniref:Uncharacterized protein n=1 Tax=Arundo donax TaxID=35708 RepID=A0A0A8Y265_ARUDO
MATAALGSSASMALWCRGSTEEGSVSTPAAQ